MYVRYIERATLTGTNRRITAYGGGAYKRYICDRQAQHQQKSKGLKKAVQAKRRGQRARKAEKQSLINKEHTIRGES